MGNETFAPVVIFAFRRPKHLRATLEALSECAEASQSELTIFVDGPRNESDVALVNATIQTCMETWPFKSVALEISEENKGLAASIIAGVGKVIRAHGSVIVLEDDLLVSPVFLRYMNDALMKYAQTPRVASIHGYSLPLELEAKNPYFLRGADCWGWASWVDRWDSVVWDSEILLGEINASKELRSVLDLDGAYPYSSMLSQQASGKIDSWAIRWHVSMFLQERLTLYPGPTLVKNIGMDGSGTHGDDRTDFSSPISQVMPDLHHLAVCEDPEMRRKVVGHFRKAASWRRRIGLKIRPILAKADFGSW